MRGGNGGVADGVIGLQGDVRSYESLVKVVQATTSRFGQLDILVNNAAGNFLCPAKDLTPNGFKTGTRRPLSCPGLVTQ